MSHELLKKLFKLHNSKYSEINDLIIQNTIRNIDITKNIGNIQTCIKSFNNITYEKLFKQTIKQYIIHNRDIHTLCTIKKYNLISDQLFKQSIEKIYITEYDELLIILSCIETLKYTHYNLIIINALKEPFEKMYNRYKIKYGKDISNQYYTVSLDLS